MSPCLRECPRELELLPQRHPFPACSAVFIVLFFAVFLVAVKEHVGEVVDYSSAGRRLGWVATTRRGEPHLAQSGPKPADVVCGLGQAEAVEVDEGDPAGVDDHLVRPERAVCWARRVAGCLVGAPFEVVDELVRDADHGGHGAFQAAELQADLVQQRCRGVKEPKEPTAPPSALRSTQPGSWSARLARSAWR
jgi:hypothetical protein